MDERIDRLLSLAEQQHATIVEQGRQIAQQAEHIGLLTQSVVLLLGEEVGVPVPEGDAAAEPQRTDMDGNPY
ncbi:hypothetical protein KX924_13890 [Streptomyces sp. II-2-2-2]